MVQVVMATDTQQSPMLQAEASQQGMWTWHLNSVHKSTLRVLLKHRWNFELMMLDTLT